MSNAVPRNEWLKPFQFKKGNSCGGRVKLPEDLRRIKALSKAEVGRIVSKFARMDMDEMDIALADPKIKVIEKAVAVLFKDAIDKKDSFKLGFLLDRAIGKVTDKDFGEDEVDEEKEIKNMTTGELLSLVRRMLPTEEVKTEESLENKE